MRRRFEDLERAWSEGVNASAGSRRSVLYSVKATISLLDVYRPRTDVSNSNITSCQLDVCT